MYWLSLYSLCFHVATTITIIFLWLQFPLVCCFTAIAGIISFWCWWLINFGDNSQNQIFKKIGVLLVIFAGCIVALVFS